MRWKQSGFLHLIGVIGDIRALSSLLAFTIAQAPDHLQMSSPGSKEIHWPLFRVNPLGIAMLKKHSWCWASLFGSWIGCFLQRKQTPWLIWSILKTAL